jgi:hypothetical protein
MQNESTEELKNWADRFDGISRDGIAGGDLLTGIKDPMRTFSSAVPMMGRRPPRLMQAALASVQF